MLWFRSLTSIQDYLSSRQWVLSYKMAWIESKPSSCIYVRTNLVTCNSHRRRSNYKTKQYVCMCKGVFPKMLYIQTASCRHEARYPLLFPPTEVVHIQLRVKLKLYIYSFVSNWSWIYTASCQTEAVYIQLPVKRKLYIYSFLSPRL